MKGLNSTNIKAELDSVLEASAPSAKLNEATTRSDPRNEGTTLGIVEIGILKVLYIAY